MGWALLASVDLGTRTAVARWLPAMCIANLRMWRSSPRHYADRDILEAHGAPRAHVVEEAFAMALRDLVVPGFEQLGMDVSAVRAWVDAGAPT